MIRSGAYTDGIWISSMCEQTLYVEAFLAVGRSSEICVRELVEADSMAGRANGVSGKFARCVS